MAMLSLPPTGLLLDHNGPGKGPFDGGGQEQDNLLSFLMEKLKMTSKQVKAWSEERLKIRDAMAVYKNTDNVDPERLQKCLENIKKAITVSSLPAMVERLEALARPINLKVMSTPEGNIFISSDTFYVEVIMGENGNVKDVMVAHCKDPLSCQEMCEALGQNNFKEFGEHLSGLSEFYQAGGDASQKSKAFNSLQCLEKDLLTILSITSKPGSTPLTVVKNSLGHCTPRAGGRHMRLTYFISPYDLLDVEQEQSKEIGPDDPFPKDIGLWVSIGLENSQPRKLQTVPLIVPATTEGKLTHNSATLGPTNSVMLPAVFSLNLSQEMPLSVTLLKQLQALVGVTIVYSEPPTALPMNTLICRHTLNKNFATDQHDRNIPHPRGYTFHVNLPDQKQRYYVTDSLTVGDVRGILISKIHFSQHSQVIQTINCLRKQANYNTLIASCVRKNTQGNDDSEEVFEVTAYHHHKMTVLFEHPDKDGMACVEFDTTDAASPKCKLYPREGEEPFCSEEYATKVLQKCLSIPITMRAILKKTEEWLKTRKPKEVPAAATPAMGPSLFPSQPPPPGPFSTLQKLAKQPFGGSVNSPYNTTAKDHKNISPPQKFTGSILGDLKSSIATFFPPGNSGYVGPPSALSPSGDPLLSPSKPSQNPMLTSLLQGTVAGGGPPALKLPVQPKEPMRPHLGTPPVTPTSPPLQPKPRKHPMLLTLLQEQNLDPNLASSIQGNKGVKKRRKRPSEKSPRIQGEEEVILGGRESSQDVFAFTKLSSMPLLQPQPPPVSSVADIFSTFDPNKPAQTLTEFCSLLGKLPPPSVDQGVRAGKKLPSRSDSIGSISGLSSIITPSPMQSPKTPLSPPSGPISRPPRSINSTPELPAPSPGMLPAPSPGMLPAPSPGMLPAPSPSMLPAPSPHILPPPSPGILPSPSSSVMASPNRGILPPTPSPGILSAPSPNVLPGMITEMLPKSDPLPELTPVLTQDHRITPKVLTTPSHQLPEDPFDFNEDLIQKNVPNFDDMFISPKQDSEEYSVNSAIAKLDSASGLDDRDDDKDGGVSALLSSLAAAPPIKPSISATRSLSLDLPGTSSSLKASGQGGSVDPKKGDHAPDNSSGMPRGKELRSPLAPPVESPLPSPKKNSSKSHTSKGKPKNFATEGVAPFQSEGVKPKPKRSKKGPKEPSGQNDQAVPKKVRKRKKKGRGRYNDSSPECPTTEDYETTVRSEQPLKMTIRVKPVMEPKPKGKASPPVPTKIKLKALPSLDSSASPSPVQQEDSPETDVRKLIEAVAQTKPTQPTPPIIKKDTIDDSKKDRAVTKADVVPVKEDTTDGGGKVVPAQPPEPPAVTKKVPEIQRPQSDSRKGSDRPPSKLQTKSGPKSTSGPKTLGKGRGDGPRRQSHGTKVDIRKPSPEDILSAILPKAVSSYRIPKLKKSSSQDTTPKVGPDGDGGGHLTELLKRVTPAPMNAKGADPGRLSSPKRTPNPSLQRPRSASPSIRYDPNKRFEAGKGTTFTKPVPGPKGGSISPRGSVSPQGGFLGKVRTGGSPKETGSSPTYKRTPSPQLRVSSSPGLPKTSSSPGLPKSSSGPTGAKSAHSPSHGSKNPSGTNPPPKNPGGINPPPPKNSAGSNPPTKVRPTGTNTATLSKAGSSPGQLTKSSPSQPSKSTPSQPLKSSPNTVTSTSQDKTSSVSTLSRSVPSAQVKPSQALKPAQGPTQQILKSSVRPPPLNLSNSTKVPVAAAAAALAAALSTDIIAGSPATTAPLTPTSATISSPRMKSPPPKPRKTPSLSAIVSKLTERVQVKTVGGDVFLEKPDDQKKIELVGDKEEVVRALLSSGHVEKIPSVTSAKAATTTKNSMKDNSAKTVKYVAPKLSQMKTAVAQALKNVAQASKQENHPAGKATSSPLVKPGAPPKTPQGSKVNVSSSGAKTVQSKAHLTEKDGINVKQKTDHPTNKVTTAAPPKAGSKPVGANKTMATTGTAKPKISIPPVSKSNQPIQSSGKAQTKMLQSPTSNRPIILSKSSSTVTSPDKGATKVTRVQIAPVTTPAAAPPGVKLQQPTAKSTQGQKNMSVPDQKESNTPKGGLDNLKGGSDPSKGGVDKLNKVKASSGKEDMKKGAELTKKDDALSKILPQPKQKDLKEGMTNSQDQSSPKKSQGKPSAEPTASQGNSGITAPAIKKDEKKTDKKQSTTEKPPAKPSLKRTVSIDGGIEMPKKILKVSLSHDEVTLAQSGPLSPKAVAKVPHKLAAPKSSPTAPNKMMAGQPGKSQAPLIPKDNDFKVPSPGMMPPSPRTMLHGVRSPGLSFKPSSPPAATSPVSPGIPSPESSGAAIGGVPSPQGVKRAATPLEAALPAKRSMLLDSCSPVSPADSDDALIIDSPNSPSIRRPKTLADKVKGDPANRGIHKSPLPQSPLVKSPSIPTVKSPTVSDGSYDAGSPLDDDLMNEALSFVREDSLQET